MEGRAKGGDWEEFAQESEMNIKEEQGCNGGERAVEEAALCFSAFGTRRRRANRP